MWKTFNSLLALILCVMIAAPQTGLISTAAADGETVMSSSFDTDVDHWFKRGSETVSHSTNTAQSGAGSLLTTGRTVTWNGPGVDATNALLPGGTYDFSIYAKLREGTAGAATIELTINQQGLPDNDPATYVKIDDKSVTAEDWVQLRGQLTVDERASGYQVYVQSTDHATVDYYIDTFTVKLVSLPSATNAETVVLYQSFEDGDIGGWVNADWNGSGTLGISADYASEGTKSLKFSERSARSTTPFINLTDVMQSGRAYQLSLNVRVGEGSDSLHIGSKIDSPLLDNIYPWLIGNQTVTATDWTTFELPYYEVPANTKEFLLWVESDPSSQSTADIYIDELRIVDITPGANEEEGDLDQSGIWEDFEDGQGNWVRRFGDGQIGISRDDNYTENGNQSLLTTVSQQYDGALLDVLGKMHKNHRYSLSARVKMAPGEQPTVMRISVQHGDSSFTNVSANVTVTSDEWALLTGTFTLATTPRVLNAYIEIANGYEDERSFYLDDFELIHIGPVAGPKPIQTDIDPLQHIYADYFKIGAAVEPEQLTGDVHKLLDFHYNSIVAENATKPASLNPSEDVWNWTAAETIANYAKENNLDFRLHTLVWHEQAATWMFNDANNQPLAATPENKQLVLDRLTTYIQTVLRHFKDMGVTINDIDVVNEVIDEGRPDGIRQSEWTRLTGTDFIKTAFIVARQELPEAKLYINDYNTHNPRKRDFLYDLVAELRAEGVPIDGVGHQTHINISGPSIQQISESIQKFALAGLDNQVTELDVSVYTNNNTSYDPIPENILVQQGYRYQELFKELVRLDNLGIAQGNPEGWISNVTLWGIADDHTWLHNRGTTRDDAPFPFDKQHQAKYAYWGMVEAVKTLEPSRLPILAKSANTAQGTPAIGHGADPVWQSVPVLKIGQSGTLEADVITLWDAQNLYVRVAVQDATAATTDQIDLFVDDDGIRQYTFPRDHSSIQETTDGYLLETSIPLTGSLGKQVKFDVRIVDKGIDDGTEHGGNGVIVSWSDPRNAQHQDSLGYGVLTYIEASRMAYAAYGTPVIDAEPDAAWANTPVYKTDVIVEQQGNAAAKAEFRLLWDEHHLYVYAVVTDSVLSDTIANAWEQDSIEVFLDQNNGKTSTYQADDGQYRINFNNVKTVGGNADAAKYTSATKVIPGGYAVEAAIQLDHLTPTAGTIVGFDFQVNNDQDGGTRDSVITWNDPTGQSYQNSSRFGIVEFVSNMKGKFVDLAGYGWARNSIVALAERDIVAGVALGQFAPGKSVTRAEFVQLLVRTLALPAADVQLPYSDVQQDAWYYEAIATAHHHGIISGQPDGSFGVAEPLSRQEMAVILYKGLLAAGWQLEPVKEAIVFADAEHIADTSVEAITALQQAGILSGMDDGTFAPHAASNRAQAAYILHQLLN